ncbi:MAG: hypothetical protein AB1916_02455 [Thermodesulfobacteriota bacterium]
MERRALPACLAATLVLALLLPAGVRAQDAAQPAPEERRDTVMGTGSGAIRTGRDADTGDTVIRVTPQEQPREEHPVPPVVIQPEVKLPAGGQQKQQNP